ncbi:hypothetical protein, partial [Holdemania filiformis]|uniref:hypothetical protein n=1 Tax=Holdemania filiformis TaxID=61171 RepID=UPI00242BF54F
HLSSLPFSQLKMSPFSGTHLRLSCFGFSLTNTIFERAEILNKGKAALKQRRRSLDSLEYSLRTVIPEL